MASNWGNKESLEEARRFFDQVSNGGGSRGRRGQGGDASTSRISKSRSRTNNSINNSSFVGKGGAGQVAWGGFRGVAGGANSGLPTLATAPPAHPFFNSRPVPNNRDDAGGNRSGGQGPADDEMDIDELPQQPNSVLTGSRCGPAHGINATRSAVPTPPRAPTTSAHSTLEDRKTQIDRDMMSNSASGTRPQSPALGMGDSMWSTSPITSTKPTVGNDLPFAPAKLVIDNDWQTTYLFEEQGRLYERAANSAAEVGDIVAEQQLRKVEKLFQSIVEARQNQAEARERALCIDARDAMKLAAPAFDKFKKAKPAQQAVNVGRAQSTSTARQDDKPFVQPPLGQRGNQYLPQAPRLAQHAQPPQGASAPAPIGKTTGSPRGPLQGLGGKARFDDPEALRLLNDFMKRGN